MRLTCRAQKNFTIKFEFLQRKDYLSSQDIVIAVKK